MLEYRVLSSNRKKVYKVQFEGAGEKLKAKCSCPAYREAMLFCKHVAALLKDDDTSVIEPSDKIEELKKISANSPLLEKAETYIPFDERKPQPVSENIKIIKDIDFFIEPFIKNTNYWKEYENNDDGSEYLTIYMRKYYKNGKPYKKPTRVSYIRYEPYHYSNFDRSGKYHEEEVVCADNKMPYAVDGQAYGYLGSAGRAFLKNLKEDLNINIDDVEASLNETFLKRAPSPSAADLADFAGKYSDPTVELKKYKELLDTGVITQEDFDAKKKQLLNL